MRLLLGCGAAGAIAGAFNAPLTGAFYAFELIIGTYTLGTFAPVACRPIVSVSRRAHADAAAASSTSTVRRADWPSTRWTTSRSWRSAWSARWSAVAIMRGVTLTEDLFRRSGVPNWLRPAIGGLALGMLALITPPVLSSGHGALSRWSRTRPTRWRICWCVVLKSCASAISLGSGFRGGLFFASLFLGALVGRRSARRWPWSARRTRCRR